MRPGLIHPQALHKPAVLLHGQGSGLAFRPGPLEAARLQTLVQQDKSVAFPVPCLDSIPASTAEQEQGIGERIQIELLLNQGSQPIYPTAQVSIIAGNVYPVGPGKVTQHDFNIRSTVSTATASAPL